MNNEIKGFPVKTLSAAVLLSLSVNAFAEDTWFTIVGDTNDAAAETVQVAPESVVAFADLRVANVRVNRSKQRKAYDGGQYRSFYATTHFDCILKEAKYRQMVYFEGPFWTGTQREVKFPEDKMPPMAFVDVKPNPRERIIQAACAMHAVQPGTGATKGS